MGWDEYREVVFARQKELGIFPADAELSPRDPDVPEWDSLSDQQKQLYARFMEVFAGFLEHCDHQFGRILQALEEIGELDNTLIMVLPDNGASSEGGVNGAFNEMSSFNYYWESLEDILPKMDLLGGPASYNHYPWGWSWAGNTPFPPLEKRCLPGRLHRRPDRSLAERHPGQGRDSFPICPRHRHGPHRTGRPGH